MKWWGVLNGTYQIVTTQQMYKVICLDYIQIKVFSQPFYSCLFL